MLTNIVVMVWQSRGIEKRLDRIESRLTTIAQDYKMFFQDIARINAKVGLGSYHEPSLQSTLGHHSFTSEILRLYRADKYDPATNLPLQSTVPMVHC